MEKFFTGKSVEEAAELAAKELGKSVDEIKYEVIEEAKKGLFGKIKSEAKIRVEIELTKAEIAYNYIVDILKGMGIETTNVTLTENEDGAVINIEGDDTGSIIGRRGETLDALQYLASMVCNKADKEYYRITIDSCGYREKRKATLEELAKKIAKAEEEIAKGSEYKSADKTAGKAASKATDKKGKAKK